MNPGRYINLGLMLTYLSIMVGHALWTVQRFGARSPARFVVTMTIFALLTLGFWWLLGWMCAHAWRRLGQTQAAKISQIAALVMGCLVAQLLSGVFFEMILTG